MLLNKYLMRSLGAALCCSVIFLSGCGRNPAGASGSLAQQQAQSYAAADAPLSFSPLDRTRAPQNDTYYFAYDSELISVADQQAVLVQANYLAAHPKTQIRLEGNTDDRGSAEYNIALGWRRAQSVAQRLELQGVHPGQIQIISFGKEKPAVLGNTAAVYAKNRRVNLVYKGLTS